MTWSPRLASITIAKDYSLAVPISIETLRNGDEESCFDLGQQVFGGTDPRDPDRVQPPNDRIIVAYDGASIVGRLTIHDYSQWYGGRSVSMGGIGGVAVAPEARGQGIAGQMLAEALRHMGDIGHSISVLYPSTATLYRSFGWEFAGHYSWARLDSADIDLGGSPNVVRLEPTDLRVRALYDEAAVSHCGWLDRNDYTWATILRNFETTPMPSYLYGIERYGELVAVAGYSYSKPSAGQFDLSVRLLFACDGSGLADVLTFLGRHNTTVTNVDLLYPSHDLQLCIAQGHRIVEHHHEPWMLRLVDPTAAMAARGFPLGLEATIELNVFDEQIERNAGRFVLTIRDGRGSLEPGGPGAVSVHVSDLAALYSGHVDPAFLASAGRLAGAESSDIDSLRLAFSGPGPTLVDYF